MYIYTAIFWVIFICGKKVLGRFFTMHIGRSDFFFFLICSSRKRTGLNQMIGYPEPSGFLNAWPERKKDFS